MRQLNEFGERLLKECALHFRKRGRYNRKIAENRTTDRERLRNIARAEVFEEVADELEWRADEVINDRYE